MKWTFQNLFLLPNLFFLIFLALSPIPKIVVMHVLTTYIWKY